jgi:LPXTG-motif cell wall-anchored protein
MKKSVFARALVAGVLLLSLPTAAYAAEGDDDDYTPGVGDSFTLVGSEVAGVCEDDVPWIDYSVVLTDPDNQVTERTASLVMSNGSQSATFVLGELGDDGTLSGRMLWPGASVAADGTPTGWPGWAFVDGQWVETDGNYAWTRGDISAVIHVNPQVSVSLSYPPGNPYCTAGPEVTGEPAGVGSEVELAATGGDFNALPFVLGGGAVLLVGAGLLVYSRRRAH